VDDHEMYSGGSVIGKVSITDPEIFPSAPLIFIGGSKSAKFGIVFNITHI